MPCAAAAAAQHPSAVAFFNHDLSYLMTFTQKNELFCCLFIYHGIAWYCKVLHEVLQARKVLQKYCSIAIPIGIAELSAIPIGIALFCAIPMMIAVWPAI